MTTKYLSGAYPTGYALNAAYASLVIEKAASIGGKGVSAAFLATITNDGAVKAKGKSSGILLAAGGTVTNGAASDTQALISGYDGVLVDRAAATVANFGSIEGTGNFGAGIYLTYGGTVINGSIADKTALIEGYGGGTVSAMGDFPSSVFNYGTILDSGDGVLLGGNLTNGSAADTAALIQCGADGVIGYGLASTVTNFGTIGAGPDHDAIYGTSEMTVINGSSKDTKALLAGSVNAGVNGTIMNFGTMRTMAYGDTVYLTDAGMLTNGSAADTKALIVSVHDAVLGEAGTITNFGTIRSASATGVYLNSSGSVTNGSFLDDAALISGVLGFYASSAAAATVTNFGTIAGTGGTALQFDSAADELVVEANSAFDGRVLGDGGTLVLARGVGTISVPSAGNVTVSGSMAATTFSDFAVVEIGAAATFTVTGHAPAALTIGFNGLGGTLKLAAVKTFKATIAGFKARDTLELLRFTATSAVLGADDILLIGNGGGVVATLQLAGDYTGDTFTTTAVAGGTDVTVSAKPGPLAPAHRFIAAMAGLVPGAAGGAVHAADFGTAHAPILARPIR